MSLEILADAAATFPERFLLIQPTVSPFFLFFCSTTSIRRTIELVESSSPPPSPLGTTLLQIRRISWISSLQFSNPKLRSHPTVPSALIVQFRGMRPQWTGHFKWKPKRAENNATESTFQAAITIKLK